MGLFIRDPEVHALARRIAAVQGTTVTDAVKTALLHELAGIEERLDRRDQELRDLFRQFDADPAKTTFDEADLYDEHGAPR